MIHGTLSGCFRSRKHRASQEQMRNTIFPADECSTAFLHPNMELRSKRPGNFAPPPLDRSPGCQVIVKELFLIGDRMIPSDHLRRKSRVASRSLGRGFQFPALTLRSLSKLACNWPSSSLTSPPDLSAPVTLPIVAKGSASVAPPAPIPVTVTL